MYLLRLIKSRAREGSAAHTRVGAGNLRSPRAGCRQGTEEVRVTRQGFSGPGFYFHGRSRWGGMLARKGDAPRLAEAGTAEDVPPAVRDDHTALSSVALGSPLQPGRASSELPPAFPHSSRAAGSDPRPQTSVLLLQWREAGWGVPRTVVYCRGHHRAGTPPTPCSPLWEGLTRARSD